MKTTSRKDITYLIFLLLAGITGGGLVIKSISNSGPGITHDSAAYIFAAVTLLEGKGLEYFGYPSPFIQWPPLYPLLLAAARLAGLGQLTASGALNASVMGLIIVICGYWLYSNLKFKQFAHLGTLLIAFSLPLVWVSIFVWTESLFILLFILFYIFIEKFMKQEKLSYLAVAGVFSALAFLDRYAGITIVITAIIFLMLRKGPLSKRIAGTLLYGLISCLPVSLWIIRNYIVSSTLMGVRLPSPYGLGLNIRRTISALRTWVAPEPMLGNIIPEVLIPYLRAFTVLLPAAVVCFFAINPAYRVLTGIMKRSKPSQETGNRAVSYNLYPVIFMCVYTVIYIAYLLASATIILFEPINSRYLVPVYVPMVMIFVCCLDFLACKIQRLSLPVLNTGLALLFAIFMIYPAANTLAAVSGYAEKGAGGYADIKYRNNELVAYVSENPAAMTYYSNSAELVSLLSGVRTYYLPKKEGPYMYSIEQFKKAVDRDRASAIVWFEGHMPAGLYSLEDIGKMYRLEVIKEFEAGTVYRIVKQEVTANE